MSASVAIQTHDAGLLHEAMAASYDGTWKQLKWRVSNFAIDGLISVGALW